MTLLDNLLDLARASDLESRTLFVALFGSVITAAATAFAAISALANLGAVWEMRAARRPLIDVSTQAGEVQFTWSSEPTDVLWPHREVRYFARPGDPAPQADSDWNFVAVLENLSENGATGIMSTLELRPSLSRRDVAMLGLCEGVGGNRAHRLSWDKGRYWLHAAGRGCGWFDSFTYPIGRVSNVTALGSRPIILSYTVFENLLLLLYREALLIGRAKSRAAMCRPRLIYRLSYLGPTGERTFRKYVIDLTIQHLTFLGDAHPIAAEYGAPTAWRMFDARVTFALRDATERRPWRFRLSPAQRVWRYMIDANQAHFGFWRETPLRGLQRALRRWPALWAWWWDERATWWAWRARLRPSQDLPNWPSRRREADR